MHSDEHRTSTMTVDPVITWLEQCRDFMGSTPEARDMAQRAINRLRPPTVDPWTVVAPLVDDLGTLRGTDGVLISDRPNHPSASADDAGYCGGYLVAETMTRRTAIALSYTPQLLVLARESPAGRAILKQLAEALQRPAPATSPVRDHLDGVQRIARLAREFASVHGEMTDPFYTMSVILKHLAGGLLTGHLHAATDDIEAFLEAKTKACQGASAEATS